VITNKHIIDIKLNKQKLKRRKIMRTLKITAALKAAAKEVFSRGYFTDMLAIEYFDSIADDTELTIADWNDEIKKLRWSVSRDLSEEFRNELKRARSIVNEWQKYFITVPRYPSNKGEHKLNNILFNVCNGEYLEDSYYRHYMPDEKQCTTLIDYLGKYLITEPDISYKYFIARKEAYKILKRLYKDEQVNLKHYMKYKAKGE
jgi:hypothetical protein